MKTFGLISEHVKITGRIKSYKSVIANDKKKVLKKSEIYVKIVIYKT